MNLEEANFLLQFPRGCGRTDGVAREAQRRGKEAILVCSSREYAKDIQSRYPGSYKVVTLGVDRSTFMGRRAPYIVLFDHFALSTLIAQELKEHQEVKDALLQQKSLVVLWKSRESRARELYRSLSTTLHTEIDKLKRQLKVSRKKLRLEKAKSKL